MRFSTTGTKASVSLSMMKYATLAVVRLILFSLGSDKRIFSNNDGLGWIVMSRSLYMRIRRGMKSDGGLPSSRSFSIISLGLSALSSINVYGRNTSIFSRCFSRMSSIVSGWRESERQSHCVERSLVTQISSHVPRESFSRSRIALPFNTPSPSEGARPSFGLRMLVFGVSLVSPSRTDGWDVCLVVSPKSRLLALLSVFSGMGLGGSTCLEESAGMTISWGVGGSLEWWSWSRSRLRGLRPCTGEVLAEDECSFMEEGPPPPPMFCEEILRSCLESRKKSRMLVEGVRLGFRFLANSVTLAPVHVLVLPSRWSARITTPSSKPLQSLRSK
mmetsp:Transcript_33049/g.64432  ORF Transcript_33049/g.64432 Transcript_33049/m.64432 type:complete len:331 (+) Transcript_33049:747-1739(+)